MIKKVELNKSVTEHLGKHIESTLQSWFRYHIKEPVTYEQFSTWQIPKHDIESVYCGIELPEGTDAYPVNLTKTILGAKEVTNALVYSPLSAMAWHTNSNIEGTRLYYTFSLSNSVFKWKDPNTGQIHEDWDERGWTARQFTISKENPLWHCIWTEGRRFSFGYNL